MINTIPNIKETQEQHHFGKFIRQSRERQGISVNQFADTIGKPVAWVLMMELGSEKPSNELHKKILETLNL